MKRMLFPVVLAAALGLGTGGLSSAQARDDALTVRADAVRSEPLRQTVPAIGRLVACRAGDVAAREAGPVAEIRVDVGHRLDRGDVIAVLDTDRITAEKDWRAALVIVSEANLATQQAQLRLRTQELKRLDNLRQSPAFNQSQYDDKVQELAIAEGNVRQAEATLASTRAQLQLATVSLRDMVITAPYAGVVTRRHTEMGAHVDRGDPIVSLTDDRCLEVEADIPVTRVSGLEPGRAVPFAIADRTYTATVRAVVPEENPLTQTRTVRFTATLPEGGGFAANQSVTLAVPLGSDRPVVTVHKDAVLRRGDKPVVFLYAGGIAEMRPVRLGEAVGDRFEVIEGVAPGDLAVVRGNERLRPGQAIALSDGAPTPPAGGG